MESSTDNERVLSFIHEGWSHLALQRPLAAWASWRRALRHAPEDAAARQALEVLAQAPDVPAAARAVYRFWPPRADRREAWDAALPDRDLDDLIGAAERFAALSQEDPTDAPAWYNQALGLAWTGRNAEAVAALDRVVHLEAARAPERAADAWLLAEVLRQGGGAEELADDLRHAWTVDWLAGDGDPIAVLQSVAVLQPLTPSTDPLSGTSPSDDVHLFEWLDRPMPRASDVRTVTDLPRVLASVIVTAKSVRLSSPDPLGLDQAQIALARALDDPDRAFSGTAVPLPLPLMDAAIWTFRFPTGLEPEARSRLSRAAVERYYEALWVHRPRHALDGRSPLQAARAAAAGDAVARAKLTAVVRFREHLGTRPASAELYQGYPFDRLRRRLGLEPHDPNTVDPEDYGCMSLMELSRLEPARLSDEALLAAFESAAALGDDLGTERLAEAVVARRPPGLSRLDGPGLFAVLVRRSLARDDPEAALTWLDTALEVDRQNRGGQDRRTFEIWRAEVHARTGHPEAAVATYQALLRETPHDAALALDAAQTLFDNGYPDQGHRLAEQARDLARTVGDATLVACAEALINNPPTDDPAP